MLGVDSIRRILEIAQMMHNVVSGHPAVQTLNATASGVGTCGLEDTTICWLKYPMGSPTSISKSTRILELHCESKQHGSYNLHVIIRLYPRLYRVEAL